MVICPVCKVDSVKKRFTWSGLLCGIFCFPCGVYFCMKDRVCYCPLCTNEICYSDGREPSFSRRDYRCYKSFRRVRDSGFVQEQGTSSGQPADSSITATADPITTTTPATANNERTISGGSESITSANSTTPVLKQ